MHLPEPTLDELLNEPMIRKVMAADRYSADDIRLLLREASARRERRRLSAAEVCLAVGVSGVRVADQRGAKHVAQRLWLRSVLQSGCVAM